MVDVRCGYISLPTGRQVHYRQCGEGPPLIILHPSPQSSAAMTNALSAFSKICSCFALDTPGYGLSDPLESKTPGMADYADAIIDATASLGFERVFVYGSATGSQLAIEMAKRHADRVAFVMLDANGHIEKTYADQLTESGYFADVTPTPGGGHLFTYWEMCRQLFYAFPWMSDRAADRLGYDIPPAAVIHATFLRYLQAGEDYQTAYKAALYTERRDHLDGLTTPTVMTRWESSPVLQLADAMIEQGLPENVTVLRAAHGLNARFDIQIDALRDMISATKLAHASTLTPSSASKSQQLKRTYIGSDMRQLHTLSNGIKQRRPLLILHDVGTSFEQTRPLAEKVALERSVLALDLPGHGGSFDLEDPSVLSLRGLASIIAEALHAEGISEIDVAGLGLGGAIGAALAQQFSVHSLTLIDPILYQIEDYEMVAERPDLTPRDDAAHIAAAWTMARNSQMFWPHWDQRAKSAIGGDLDLSPSTLHSIASGYLRVGANWRAFSDLALAINWNGIFAQAPEATTVAISERYPCLDRLGDKSWIRLEQAF